MIPATATRDPRFGSGALALAARSLGTDRTSTPSSAPSACRVAFRARGLSPEERAALAALPGSRLDEGADECVWSGDPAVLAASIDRLPGLAPLAAAVDGERAPLPRPEVMGIVNVTPDSFSDGGRYLDPRRAVEHGLTLVAEGAELLDVGGESTRPGAPEVALDEELARVAPVIERLALEAGVPISIDTTKAAVARRALDLGASFVNDVSAGTADPGMLPLVAERGAGYCVMHMLGTPRTMQVDPRYGDPVAEILESLRARVAACVAAGIETSRIVMDPGLGFGKLVEHNVELLRRLPELRSLGLPLLVGVSNKSFLGRLAGEGKATPGAPAARTGATAAAVTACVFGGVRILRVHDVRTMVQAARVAHALRPTHS